MESKITYFENPGKENTEAVLRIAKQKAEELGIRTILVASTTGNTALKAMEAFKGMRVIVVTHFTGFAEPNSQEFTEENKKVVQSKGGIILTTTHAFGGLGRAMRQGDIPEATTTYIVGDIVATTLRVFGQGMKVVCEIALMAADAGLIPEGKEVIAVAGTGRGADTVIILRTATSKRFLDLRALEILAKPRG